VLIIGLSVITVLSLTALFVLRRREQNYKEYAEVERKINELDAALDGSVAELNKMGAAIVKEIDEKYQTMMFLYNLMEDKQNELKNDVWSGGENSHDHLDEVAVSEMVASYVEAHSAKLRLINEDAVKEAAKLAAMAAAENDNSEAESKEATEAERPKIYNKRPSFSNPRHKKIWELYSEGQNISEIAKKLSMGQGEVKLILDLAERVS